MAHQGQCPHQVSLQLADPHCQGLTRFLSQGLLKALPRIAITGAFNSFPLRDGIFPKTVVTFYKIEQPPPPPRDPI